MWDELASWGLLLLIVLGGIIGVGSVCAGLIHGKERTGTHFKGRVYH